MKSSRDWKFPGRDKSSCIGSFLAKGSLKVSSPSIVWMFSSVYRAFVMIRSSMKEKLASPNVVSGVIS